MSVIDAFRRWLYPITVQPELRPFSILKHVTGAHIRQVLLSKYPNAYVRLSDKDYSAVKVKEFSAWLKNDNVSEWKYYSQHRDCDDFARGVRCNMFKVNREYKTTITMAYCEGYAHGVYHAFNLLIDNNDIIFLVEPQTDNVLYDNDSYKPDFILL